MSLSKGSKAKKSKKVFHVDEAELLCSNGCGFYGNVAWQGYCSKCWREVCSQKQQDEELSQIESDERYARQLFEQEQSASSGVPAESGTTPPIADTVQTGHFEKFEEKKKSRLQAISRAKQMRSLLQKKSPNRDKEVDFPPPGHQRVQKQLSTESQSAGEAFREFLKTLPKLAGDDIQRKCKVFGEQFLHFAGQSSVEEQAEKVQDFYQNFIERMDRLPAFKGFSQENKKTILDQIEKFLMTRLYSTLFSPVLTDDEQKDLAIQNRIRRLHWVTADMLETVVDDQNREVVDLIEKAQTELIEMNAKRAPVEKLHCVVQCSKLIFRIIQKCQNLTAASADEYLPLLIYMILKANPPQLHSNIQYISRFSNPTRLLQGEAGYYFTNLCCAITFVENLDAKSLALSQEKYDNYMSGKEVPPGKRAEEPICEGLRMMYANLSALEELRIRQEKLMRNAREFSEEIERWKQSITSQVQDVITSKPLIIKRYTKQPVDIDKDVEDDIKGLPIPMEPQKVK